MAKGIYRDPIFLRLRDVLNETGPACLKNRYYFGDPIMVNPNSLPACFISYDRQQFSNVDNAHLGTNASIVLNVVYDHRRDLNQALDNIESHMSVVNIICGRDETFAVRKDTLVGTLRMHEDLAPNLWIDVGTMSEANFGLGIGKRGPGIYTTEGTLRIQIKQHQIKPELI